jgi:hypothetical protein
MVCCMFTAISSSSVTCRTPSQLVRAPPAPACRGAAGEHRTNLPQLL